MSEASDQPRDGRVRSIRPPGPVVAAGVLVIAQGAGLVVLAVLVVVSGLGHRAATGQLIGQGVYFVVLALLMAWCGLALIGGRRWGRTPVIVLQIVLLAVGYYMAVPSGRPLLGLGLAALAVLTGGLLFARPATAWINRFPVPGSGPG